MKLLTALALIALFAYLLASTSNHDARAGAPPVQLEPAGTRYQGKTAKWWARRAVQARKDANKRGRTIRQLQAAARRELVHPTGHWLDGAFLCIYQYERNPRQGWQTDTGNGYRGGLQMDWSFSNTYAPAWVHRTFGRNPARWPASVQITAAIHAWTSRGFSPWPNTRRMCGL